MGQIPEFKPLGMLGVHKRPTELSPVASRNLVMQPQLFCGGDIAIQSLNLILGIHVTGGIFKLSGTTSVPKSVPRFELDKVRMMS